MIGLVQRVTCASVAIAGEHIAQIGTGMLVLTAVTRTDDAASAARLAERLLNYRIFTDADGRMNLSLRDIDGGLLLVPQFTLAADTRRGRRPGFDKAAPPEQARALFETLLDSARQYHSNVASGRFGADMQVSLTNDGPVTFWLES